MKIPLPNISSILLQATFLVYCDYKLTKTDVASSIKHAANYSKLDSSPPHKIQKLNRK